MTTSPSSISTASAAPRSQRLSIALALLAVYVIWGSTYLVISIAIESIPPLMMAGARFLLSGLLVLLLTRLRGMPLPTPRQWGYGLLFGVMLLGFGNGGVTFAEQYISSHVAAMIVGSVPLWMVVWAAVGGKRPALADLAGVLLGFAGIVLLNLEADLSAEWLGIVIVLGGAVSWSLGSTLKRRVQTAPGLVGAGAEMLCAGGAMLVASFAFGERLTAVPTRESLLAFVYLFVFGGVIAYSAYAYLLGTVRPTVATSYAYVNPVIAVFLGVVVASEPIGQFGWVALACIVGGVALIMLWPAERARQPVPADA